MALIALIYVHTGVIVFRLARRKYQGGFVKKGLDIATLAAAMSGGVCIAYGYFIEPNELSITHVQINTPKIPVGSEPIRIVHLSDIHSEREPRLEPLLPEAVARQKPDVIVLSGDYYNSRDAIPVFKTALVALTKIAPTLAVKGNWETDFYRRTKPFEGTDAHELDGNAVRLQIRGVPIWFAGLAAHNELALVPMLKNIPRDEFVVLVYHYPDSIHEAADLGVDLYCAGHTHGGQVTLPFYGALVTLSKFGKRYEAGLYQERSTWMYVNRGVGLDGGMWPRVRFMAPPEVTTIDIRPGS
jgi:predicted MPP superfamily phosphohydrolase